MCIRDSLCPLTLESLQQAELTGETASLLADSGAGLHACPLWHASHVPLEPSPKVIARGASGILLQHFGRRVVGYELPEGTRCRIAHEVMNVSKPVLSVGRLNAAGFTLHLAPEDAYLQKGKKVPLRRDNEVFFLDVKVLRVPGQAGGKTITPVSYTHLTLPTKA